MIEYPIGSIVTNRLSIANLWRIEMFYVVTGYIDNNILLRKENGEIISLPINTVFNGKIDIEGNDYTTEEMRSYITKLHEKINSLEIQLQFKEDKQ